MNYLIIALCFSLLVNAFLVAELCQARWLWKFWRRQFDVLHEQYMDRATEELAFLRERGKALTAAMQKWQTSQRKDVN